MPHAIEARGLEKTFIKPRSISEIIRHPLERAQPIQALRGVDLEVAESEILALLGPTAISVEHRGPYLDGQLQNTPREVPARLEQLQRAFGFVLDVEGRRFPQHPAIGGQRPAGRCGPPPLAMELPLARPLPAGTSLRSRRFVGSHLGFHRAPCSPASPPSARLIGFRSDRRFFCGLVPS